MQQPTNGKHLEMNPAKKSQVLSISSGPVAYAYTAAVMPEGASCHRSDDPSVGPLGYYITLQGTNISHLGKRKIIFKIPCLVMKCHPFGVESNNANFMVILRDFPKIIVHEVWLVT